MRKLQVDISSFARLRQAGYLYVDKTKELYRMVTGGRCFFLSRPRRFGKSLVVSTLRELLSGNRELFEGLWIDQSDYAWPKHAVVALDFSGLIPENKDSLRHGLQRQLRRIAKEFGIDLDASENFPSYLLEDLLTELHARYGRVAILIDEYDSPLTKTLSNEKLCREMQGELSAFFSIIKLRNEIVDFVFITGVSAFSKAGLFSGINDLKIITLHEEFVAICGYTDTEVDDNFKEHIEEWCVGKRIAYKKLRKEIKEWYNGYRFGANAPSVYNPFSLMNALQDKNPKNFWIESGAPGFLLEQLKKESRQKAYPTLPPERVVISQESLGICDVSELSIEMLLFQTGYLTIRDYDKRFGSYELGYPNKEVQKALQIYLLQALAGLAAGQMKEVSERLFDSLNNCDLDAFVKAAEELFAHVPHQLHMKEEKFYHALLHTACSLAGVETHSEYSVAGGRSDLYLKLPKQIYIIEIKCNKPADAALAQIEERGYHIPFRSSRKPVTLMGLSFHKDSEERFCVTHCSRSLS